MFKKILKIVLAVLAVLLIAIAGIGVYVSRNEHVEVIDDYVIKLDTTTKDNSAIVSKLLDLFVGNYSGGKCSSVVKQLANGDVIVGRNLDDTLNQKPIYIGRTNIEGFYETVYATHLESLGPDFDSCKEKGLPKYMTTAIPFLACDSLNSEGLYIEINMRENQKDEEGNFVFSCSGTNKDSNIRINVCELPTYLTLRCKNTNEALELIKTLNIYTANDEDSWTLCLMIADAQGNYGVLEFGCNELRWLPNQNIQTNYYISKDFNEIQIYKQGIGRYEYLENNIDDVKTEDDMLKLIEGVKYSEIYNIDNPSFNIRSEFAGDEEHLTNEYLDNDINWNDLLKEYREEANLFNTQSDNERRDEDCYWISLYSVVANCSSKTLSLSFFEDYKISYVLSFD